MHFTKYNMLSYFFLTLIYYSLYYCIRLTICCRFYIIDVRSYNPQLEMRVLQNCLNLNYSQCLSHWTAVGSSSVEISVTFTRIYQIVFGSFALKEGRKIFENSHTRNFEASHLSLFRNLWILSFEIVIFIN